MTRDLIFDDLAFGEGPRWHDGRLWLSDIFAKRILAIGLDGTSEVVCELNDHPSGLGWLPDGRLLVVSILDRRVLRMEDGVLVEHANLEAVCPGNCNDMVVDRSGRAYVGNTGYEYRYRGQPVPVRNSTSLVLVHPDGQTEKQPGTLMFPNGCCITPDGRTLIVAQSHVGRLTAYRINDDGSLSDERVFAALPGGRDNPDGIAVDAEGAVWVADPHHQCCIRVLDGGQITHIVDTAPYECVACALGGDDRRTLFLVLAQSRSDPASVKFVVGSPPSSARVGRVEAMQVDVPGAGWP